MNEPTDTIVVRFHDGPKAGEHVQFSVPSGKGAPQRIEMIGLDPDNGTERRGEYQQSAFHPYLYQWQGWGKTTPFHRLDSAQTTQEH